jgi:hypothetical protein
MKVYYFKRHQRDDLWNYYKLLDDRNPPAQETVNFLNPQPIISFREFDLKDAGSKIEYDAMWEAYTRIDAAEYEAAYKRATADDFTVYINGKPQKSIS